MIWNKGGEDNNNEMGWDREGCEYTRVYVRIFLVDLQSFT